ncbi:hypothetical protein W97_08993 [Coniosporium apollinis CBS 100218]|uniref:BZIP domain-containing protein n=1 Tax=Coniosporium apollinis (strain CBS 100218) TaxID=1168221 RepID=R7Z735_CONA1|nr:uncharacterized protein W97_08993 [Coniosporium apollinis CBS 100218]EON69731.1 hypothetical protein W97_08993 [Coniosporium apollinis CBS 100218]
MDHGQDSTTAFLQLDNACLWDGRPDSALDAGTDVAYGFSPTSRAMRFDPPMYQQSIAWNDGYLNLPNVTKSVAWQQIAKPLPHLAIPPSVYARQKHGQITPPDERSPESGESSPSEKPETFDGEEEDEVMETEENIQASCQQGAGRRRKSTQKQEGDDSTSPRRRKRTKLSNPEENPEEFVKREKFLERNRVAASKCRQKKKEWTSNLEQQARELTAQRAHLQAYVASLRDEVLYLKDQMLRHSDCNCVKMREYLSHSVSNMSPPMSSIRQLADVMDLDHKSSACSPSDVSVAESMPLSRRDSTVTLTSRKGKMPAVSPTVSVASLGMSSMMSPRQMLYGQ